jgi:probable F420-dependent oxidoreductase
MAGYLDELDALNSSHAAPQPPMHRILAAYGPRMLELARDRSAGAHTYHVNVAHTARAREILGPDSFLGVEQAVLFETDPDRARAIARRHLTVYLDPGNTYNLAKFRRLGYSEQDISNGGSDRFIDELVFWGGPSTIARRLNAHVEAGADHVAVQVIGIDPGQSAMPYWRMLGKALLPQGVGADS